MSNNKYINKLKDKRVLVFGGTSGIGFGVVEACLEQGATVIISGSNQAKLDKTAERLTKSYPEISPNRIITHPCDLLDEEGLDTNLKALLVAVTENGVKKIDHVVFTAGDAALHRAPNLQNVTPDRFRIGSTIRVTAPVMLAKHLMEFQKKSPDSSYTLTGGMLSSKPPPGRGIGVSSGGQLEALTRGLAVDMAPIRVNLVHPGIIRTEMTEGMGNIIEQWREKTLTKRVGRPEDIAEAYLWFIKDGFATGAIAESNGGGLLV